MSYPQTLISANGTTKLNLAPGEYTILAAGNFGGGTLSIRWKVDTEASVEYPEGALTGPAGLIIAVVGRVDLVLSGASSPSISIGISRIHREE